MPIKVKALPPYRILYKLPDGTNIIVVIGGRGGSKTYEVSKFISFSSTVKEKRSVILRDEKELIRESILNEVLLRYDTANAGNVLGQVYERLETGIKDRRNDGMVVFTKGFRASSNKKTANLKGVSDIDIAVVEEGEDIRDVTKFNTFADSIRKEGSIIIVILNTPDIGHWIITRFFNLVHITMNDVPELKGKIAEKEIDGYYKLIPKEIDGFVCIQTSYLDNVNPVTGISNLPNHIIHNYQAYGDPTSTTYDLHYYLTAIKGFASTGRKGQILKKVKPISLADYLKLPYKEYYGQDFGTSSPAGLVGVKRHRNTTWCRQLNYLPMSTLDIGKTYCTLKFHPVNDTIIGDSADRKSREKLASGWTGDELDENDFRLYPNLRNGWNILPARKGRDSVNYGIDNMVGMNLYAVEESKDLWNEVNSYIYAKDKNEQYTNDPIDEFNHLIDPWRYVLNYLDTGQESSGGMNKAN